MMTLDPLFHLAVVGAVAAAAFGLGRPMVWWIGSEEEDASGRLLWSLAIGLVLGGLGIQLLGTTGFLGGPTVAAFTFAAATLGVFWARLEHCVRRLRCEESTRPIRETPAESLLHAEALPAGYGPPRQWTVLAQAAAVAACLAYVCGTLGPPLASSPLGMRLSPVHLALVERADAVQVGAPSAYVPHLLDAWYLWAMALGGPASAKMMHGLLFVMTGAMTFAAATRIVGRSWAWVAVVPTLCTPALLHRAALPADGVVLAFLCTAAFAAWWSAVRDEGCRSWLATAVLFASAAVATHPAALFYVLGMAVPAAWSLRAPSHHRAFSAGAVVLLTAVGLTVAGVRYASLHDELAAVDSPDPVAVASRAAGLPPEYQLGMLLPALLPSLLVARRLRGLGTLLTTSVAYVTAWWWIGGDAASLTPVVPLAVTACVWAVIEWERFPLGARRTAAFAAGVLLALLVVDAVASCRNHDVLQHLGRSHDEYLARHEPTWKPAAAVGQLLTARDRILSTEPHGLYLPRAFVSEEAFRRQTHYDRRVQRPEELCDMLRRAGVTHILLATDDASPAAETSPLHRLTAAVDTSSNDSPLLKILDCRTTPSGGSARHYQLLWIRANVPHGRVAREAGATGVLR